MSDLASRDRLQKIIVAPVVTEKTLRSANEGKYTFRVLNDANKIEIRQAVEAVFDVKVKSVNTLMVKAKRRRRTMAGRGRVPDWKKAIVTLQPGQKIEILGGV
jgi:large subunit ribosomal protein L23